MPIFLEMQFSEIRQHLIEKEMPARLTELQNLLKAIPSIENIKKLQRS